MSVVQLYDKRFKPFISEKEIQSWVKNLGERINNDLQEKEVVFLGILNGAAPFLTDLLKHINFTCKVSFIKLSSYQGTESSGKVEKLIGVNENLTGKTVVVVEDIIDSGITIKKIMDILEEENPAEIKVATLLFKPNAYQEKFHIDYIGKEIGNEFIVGYGLDYNGLGRNLNDIYIITD